MHSAVTRGYWLRQTDSRRQAAEILRRFDLAGTVRPFARCMACNSILRATDRSAVLPRIPPRAAELYDQFLECSACHRVYWHGSHVRRMERWIEQLLQFDHEG
jgi:hypothetical protein